MDNLVNMRYYINGVTHTEGRSEVMITGSRSKVGKEVLHTLAPYAFRFFLLQYQCMIFHYSCWLISQFLTSEKD